MIVLKISKRTQTLGTENSFVVLKEVNDLTKQGKDIISFCIGQPDFDTPNHIKEAAIQAIKKGKTGYTPSPGIPKLREAVAQYFSKTRKIKVNPESIVVGNGVKPFVAYAILSVTDYGKGDEVLYPNPGYPIYESQIIANGAIPVPLPLLERKRYSFDIDYLEKKLTIRADY
jgi:aspartate/methionine/tyrosine aminotransferase